VSFAALHDDDRLAAIDKIGATPLETPSAMRTYRRVNPLRSKFLIVVGKQIAPYFSTMPTFARAERAATAWLPLCREAEIELLGEDCFLLAAEKKTRH